MAIATGDFDSEDNAFPEFDDWYENRTKAILGGASISSSDLKQGELDLEKLNICLYAAGISNSQTQDKNTLTREKNKFIEFFV